MSNEEIEESLEGYSEEEAMFLKMKIWFDSRIEKLQQIADLKEDEGLLIQNDDGEKIEVEGDLKKGVRWGCGLAVDIFGEFPIKIE
ncbi:MAG: hypothetical protein WD511_01015 [Balneolaceae bacterium]